MNERKQPLRVGPRVETRLSSVDIKRLDEAAKLAGQTRADFSRQAIIWYLDNLEKLKETEKETAMAEAMRYATVQIIKAINSGVDRICAMLARQGRAIGTLYELQWMAIPDPDQADMLFAEASKKAKQKQAKYVQEDEKDLIAGMKKVVTNP